MCPPLYLDVLFHSANLGLIPPTMISFILPSFGPTSYCSQISPVPFYNLFQFDTALVLFHLSLTSPRSSTFLPRESPLVVAYCTFWASHDLRTLWPPAACRLLFYFFPFLFLPRVLRSYSLKRTYGVAFMYLKSCLTNSKIPFQSSLLCVCAASFDALPSSHFSLLSFGQNSLGTSPLELPSQGMHPQLVLC